MSELIDFDYSAAVAEMVMEEKKGTMKKIQQKIYDETSFTKKCILVKKFIPSQSTFMESVIRTDLEIGEPVDETSGDGCKDGLNYEIKHSGHAKNGKFNFVQIRPDHNVDYYIFTVYNMYYKSSIIGKGYIFKVPANIVDEWIVTYGGYAHGTTKKLGRITKDNIKGRNCEYALRGNSNAKPGTKNYRFWQELLEYEVEYAAKSF